MIAADRHYRIIQLLQKESAVRTTELASRLGVTDETIRRDLDTLHTKGDVVRTHGGATLPNHPYLSRTLDERSLLEPEKKKAIAEEAVKLIQPHDILFLDASSTVQALVKVMPHVELTVITNAHDVITMLSMEPFIKVIGTGGIYDPHSRSYYGPAVGDAVSRYNISKMFFSCNGVDPQKGISESSEEQGRCKEKVMESAEQIIVLADSTKLDVRSKYFFCDLKQVDTLVTDNQANSAFLKQFKNQKLDVIKAKV